MHTVVGRLTPIALARVHTNAREFRFYGSHQELTAAIKRKYPRVRIGKGKTVKGMFDKDGIIHADGPGILFGRPATTEEYHAHEVAHCIDGVSHDLSEAKEWKQSWRAEIRDGGLLGPGSTKSPSEGFSEFGALLLSSGLTAGRVEEIMPFCVKFWSDRGLL
jgi:hypothetical protein